MIPRYQIILDKIWNLTQRVVFIPLLAINLLALLLWRIGATKTLMQRMGFDLPVLFDIALTVTLFVLIAFESQMRQMNNRLKSFAPPSTSQMIQGGVQQVYEEMKEIFGSFNFHNDNQRTFDVLGLTLFTAWNYVRPELVDGLFREWRVNIFLLSPEFLAGPIFPPDWAGHAKGQIDSIKLFANNNANVLKANRTVLSVRKYEFFPAIHGFRTGAGHLFISYIQWENKLLHDPFEFYEFFPPSDNSDRAVQYRTLFDNWIQRAKGEPDTLKVV